MKSVVNITENGLCVGCGICKAICPKNAIEKVNDHGVYVPKIDMDKCIDCGLCYKLCPGRGFEYKGYYSQNNIDMPNDLYVGNYSNIYNGKIKDDKLLLKTASGGFTTNLINFSLEKSIYNVAFLVDTYKYTDEVKTNPYYRKEDLFNTSRSRYIPVSQENTVRYMLGNRSNKVIIVATSCCVHAILNVISYYKLNRENYLIIGLFCEKTMNENVYNYFSEHPNCKKEIENLFFKNKEAGGWPGNVRLEYTDGTYTDLPNTERMKVKDYYMLEKCLYCLDKLNQFADISVGDNYTKDTTETVGSSSVIIRTEQGEKIFDLIKDSFEYNTTTMDKIKVAQHIETRKLNSAYIKLKESEDLIEPFQNIKNYRNIKNKYTDYLKKIKIGKNGGYKEIMADIKKRNTFTRKVIRKIKRILIDKI
ncbi:MAG: Coenzyme F420 hydrogenase/dehydrogenase, beta subunit C-terminal domain [Clostridia bacterium]